MPTIMVIEDNLPSRDALSRRLERSGYKVIPAVDAPEAMTRARALKPDLILLDLDLPSMDGWKATHLLKADRITQHVPIIVLSAHAMTSDGERALAAGGGGFDSKPVRMRHLLEKIEILLTLKDAGV
jgi:CheY-like chemotaxis protein